ncbi:hypothetical protein ACFX1Z_031818 [Malus domestica]
MAIPNYAMSCFKLPRMRILERGLRWRVGDRWSIHIHNNPWLPRPHTYKVHSKHVDMQVMVDALINSE